MINRRKFIDKLKALKFRFNTYLYRRYFDEYKCIFIHIPRCAGTSILYILSGGGTI